MSQSTRERGRRTRGARAEKDVATAQKVKGGNELGDRAAGCLVQGKSATRSCIVEADVLLMDCAIFDHIAPHSCKEK